jgi:maleamate amidohydrolase
MMNERRHAWEDVIDDEIRALTRNYAARMGLRNRPALLCIDNYNAVFGDRPQPLLEAIERFPGSCGLAAWDALEPTRRLMAAARKAAIPIIHTTADLANRASAAATRATKRAIGGRDPEWDFAHFPDLAPQSGELVIRKTRASAFYGTALSAHLVQLGVDTLVICGNSTSGCVRASVNEAFMHGYSVALVEDCVFDRNWLSHKVNLYDMNTKYGDVIFVDEAVDYIADHAGWPAGALVRNDLAHNAGGSPRETAAGERLVVSRSRGGAD